MQPIGSAPAAYAAGMFIPIYSICVYEKKYVLKKDLTISPFVQTITLVYPLGIWYQSS